jgi:glucose-1-phosphate adenylyltransferase
MSSMQFSSVLPLEGKACVCPVRRGGDANGCERLKVGDSSSFRHERALRRMCNGTRGAANGAQCVLTSDASPDTLVSFISSDDQIVRGYLLLASLIFLDAKKPQVVRSSFRRNYADPNEVAAVILGGGTGTQLFPLTSTRATPAVR